MFSNRLDNSIECLQNVYYFITRILLTDTLSKTSNTVKMMCDLNLKYRLLEPLVSLVCVLVYLNSWLFYVLLSPSNVFQSIHRIKCTVNDVKVLLPCLYKNRSTTQFSMMTFCLTWTKLLLICLRDKMWKQRSNEESMIWTCDAHFKRK